MRTIMLALFVLATISSSAEAEQFRCASPKGVSMFSASEHKVVPDNYLGDIQPVIMVNGTEMTIVWDDRGTGGRVELFKATVVQRSGGAISGVEINSDDGRGAVTLYTMDTKRGYLYISTHKELVLADSSAVICRGRAETGFTWPA